MFNTLEMSDLERIFSYKKRYPGDIFRGLPRKRKYFNLVLNCGYTLSDCWISLPLSKIGRDIKVTFTPSITSAWDMRLGFLDFLEDPHQFVEFVIRHEDKMQIDYKRLAFTEVRQLLIREKKLTATYCCSYGDSCKDWIAIWGVEDLTQIECMHVYYHFSSKVRTGKRERGDLDKLLEYVQRNKGGFVCGILRARKSTFMYEVLEAILERISDLSPAQREAVETAIGGKGESMRRYKRQKTSIGRK